jgi:hypothetical protein
MHSARIVIEPEQRDGGLDGGVQTIQAHVGT